MLILLILATQGFFLKIYIHWAYKIEYCSYNITSTYIALAMTCTLTNICLWTGPPVFESCPSEETVLLSVPESGDHVIYPTTPRAFDSTGAQLTVSSSYKIDEEGIHLHWEGDEMESHHTVVLWAIDGHNQEVVCEINVTLQGMT